MECLEYLNCHRQQLPFGKAMELEDQNLMNRKRALDLAVEYLLVDLMMLLNLAFEIVMQLLVPREGLVVLVAIAMLHLVA